LFLEAVRSLILRLESADEQAGRPPAHRYALDVISRVPRVAGGDRGSAPDFIHRFDTDRLDLQRSGYVIELRESVGSIVLVVGRSGSAHDAGEAVGSAEARIDRSWAIQILSGAMSPLDALQSRLGTPDPAALENVRAVLAGRSLGRVDSRTSEHIEHIEPIEPIKHVGPHRDPSSAVPFESPAPARRWASG
jgi:hypothetical protein